jgi:hypothetical protein
MTPQRLQRVLQTTNPETKSQEKSSEDGNAGDLAVVSMQGTILSKKKLICENVAL